MIFLPLLAPVLTFLLHSLMVFRSRGKKGSLDRAVFTGGLAIACAITSACGFFAAMEPEISLWAVAYVFVLSCVWSLIYFYGCRRRASVTAVSV